MPSLPGPRPFRRSLLRKNLSFEHSPKNRTLRTDSLAIFQKHSCSRARIFDSYCPEAWMKPTVGFVGLGLMGMPMCRNLLKAGFPLVLWNRTREKAEGFARENAQFDVKVGTNPRETAAKADALITIVSDPPALEEVLWGRDGAMEGLRRGSTYIDSSTVSPELARKIGAACTERGVGFLDAPVTGGTWGAEKGELVFMVGGEKEVLERAKPALQTMAKHIFLLGPTGAGQTVKLAMNLILALQVDALAEALALVTTAGVPGERLIEVL